MPGPSEFDRRVARHAALGDAVRLALVDDLVVSDRSPTELCERLALTTNLLAHHLDVLEVAGLITRTSSAGDARRRYVRLMPAAVALLGTTPAAPRQPMLFLCTHNSARSQLAAAIWTARTGRAARSAGTDPSPAVHRGAVAAARRAGLDLSTATPTAIDRIPEGVQVVTVCDRVHEQLRPTAQWWHWSIPDPVEVGTAAAFDAVVAELRTRIEALT